MSMIKTLTDINALRSIIPANQCPDPVTVDRFITLINATGRMVGPDTTFAVRAIEAVLMDEIESGNQNTPEFQEALALYFDYLWWEEGPNMTDELIAEASNAATN